MRSPAQVTRRDLERALAGIPPFRHPRADLEQYRTPEPIAAALLLHAREDGAIVGRRVLDLGCGTGAFAIGAALLGATHATGLDIEAAAIADARAAAQTAGVADKCTFTEVDVRAWQPAPASFDTVLMNPPFGAQAANRHADRAFLQAAAAAVRDTAGGSVWFLALTRTEGFLKAAARELGAGLERVADWQYPILAQFSFHEKEAQVVHIGGYRLGWKA